MRGNSPFTISGGGMGVFEGQPFGMSANMGMINGGFMGDFGAAGGRKGRKGGAPISVQTGTSPGEYPAGRGRKVRKGQPGIPVSVDKPIPVSASSIQQARIQRTQKGWRAQPAAYAPRSPRSTTASVRDGRVDVNFDKIDLVRSGGGMMGLNRLDRLPPGLPGSRTAYSEEDMFGLGQTYARGFGHHMAARGSGPGLYYGNQELFGLGQTYARGFGHHMAARGSGPGLYYGNQELFGLGAVSGPLAGKNAPLVPVAQVAVAEYLKNSSLIGRLPLKSQQAEANAIITKKWWPTGFLRTGRYNLNDLLGKVRSVLDLPEPFYKMVISGNSISIDSRYAEYLEAFQKGNRALRNYMRQFIPTELAPVVTEREILRTVGLDSATLIAQASAAAQKARATRLPNDVIAARTIADTARSAAETEGDMGAENLSAANALFSEMDDLAKQVGAPAAAPVAVAARAGEPEAPSKFPTIPVVIGGVVILGLVTYLLVSKK